MIWIDYTMLGLLAMSLVVGLARGYRLETYSLFFWLVAMIVGLSFSGEFSLYLTPYISHKLTKLTAAFALLFVITLSIGQIIRLLLGETLQKPKLSVFERLGGLIMGAVHGLLTILILITLAGLTSLPKDKWWQESRFLPPFQHSAVWLRDHIPSAFTDQIHYR